MRSTAPGNRDPRPPVAITAVPGAAGRRSVWLRPLVVPLVWEDGPEGFPPHHPYVRRFWSAVMGPGAVADLLRLIVAARNDRRIPLPGHLPLLTMHDLTRPAHEAVWVRMTVPPLGGGQLRSVSPLLRAEHRRALQEYFGTSVPPAQ